MIQKINSQWDIIQLLGKYFIELRNKDNTSKLTSSTDLFLIEKRIYTLNVIPNYLMDNDNQIEDLVTYNIYGQYGQIFDNDSFIKWFNENNCRLLYSSELKHLFKYLIKNQY